MEMDAKLADEQGRIAALHRYEVLDTPVEEPFERITRLVQMVLNVPIAIVSLIDTDRQWSKACVGFPRNDGTPRELSFCSHTILSREALNVPDATQDARFAENPFVTDEPRLRSYLGVPLMTPDGYNVGALCAVDTRPRDFSKEQVEMLSSFASLVVDELELRRIAQTDHLTGASTRRGFVLELEKQLVHLNRSEQPCTLVLLDVDHFKKVNDTHGHPTGDAVLRNLASCLRAVLRRGDVLGRLGGEEFGILLPGTDFEAGFRIAEQIRETVAQKPLVAEPELQITISLGVAAPAATEDAAQWMAAADRALYAAKRSGRNRTCID